MWAERGFDSLTLHQIFITKRLMRTERIFITKEKSCWI